MSGPKKISGLQLTAARSRFGETGYPVSSEHPTQGGQGSSCSWPKVRSRSAQIWTSAAFVEMPLGKWAGLREADKA